MDELFDYCNSQMSNDPSPFVDGHAVRLVVQMSDRLGLRYFKDPESVFPNSEFHDIRDGQVFPATYTNLKSHIISRESPPAYPMPTASDVAREKSNLRAGAEIGNAWMP